MDVVILSDGDEVASRGAAMFRRVLAGKPAAVFGLATGSSPLALYARLAADCAAGRVTFRRATTFNLDEYLGIDPANPQSYRASMRRNLFDRIDIDPANTFLPECAPGEDPLDVGPRYEQRIGERGGIDLQLLGIGANGHIGFNEPTSSLNSRTRIKTLTRETIESNRRFFEDAARQPQLAITMGIATIMDAREILLIATGEAKAEAVRKAIEGPVSAMCPASVLQLHERVTMLLDAAAASALERRDYYQWVQEQKRRLLGNGEAG